MIVKELLRKLIDCPMDGEINIANGILEVHFTDDEGHDMVFLYE